MSVGLKHGYYWKEIITDGPHDWRAADPRFRRLLLRGLLPEDFLLADLNELEELMRLLDDLDNLAS